MAAQAENFYQLLQVAPEASLESIRQSFHAAALASHPDRQKLRQAKDPTASVLQNALESDASYSGSSVDVVTRSLNAENSSLSDASEHFHRVQLAWETLRDPDSRRAYDEQLRRAAEREKAQASVPINEEVFLEEMETGKSPGGDPEYTYPCRCGDCYCVEGEELLAASQHTHEPGNEGAKGHKAAASGTSGESHQVIVQCRSCSLHIRVHFREAELSNLMGDRFS